MEHKETLRSNTLDFYKKSPSVGEDGENPEFHTHQGSSKKNDVSFALLKKRRKKDEKKKKKKREKKRKEKKRKKDSPPLDLCYH
jgi:hypothetical protein